MTDTFDYVIVGAGSAGSLLAHRLGEDAGVTVCVLESGGPDTSPWIAIPGGFVKLVYSPDFTWPFYSEPSPHTNGRALHLPQGRVVGGSSSINGMVYARGQRGDFDSWAQRGNRGWGYRDVLPYFRRAERRIGAGDDRFRGRDGRLTVSDANWPHPLCEAFIAGAVALGIPRNHDSNGIVQEGAGYFQRTIYRRRRMSVARAFLHPAVARGNVDLRTGVHVHAVTFDGRRARGIAYRQGETLHEVRARREVIVCAGAVNSPKLLQLSGVGDAGRLGALGVPLVHHLPSVGENLRDHFTVRMVARAKNCVSINETTRGARFALEVAKWVLGRPSILSLSPSLVHVYWKSDAVLDRGDLQVLFTPGSYKEGRNYVLDDMPGMSCGARQQRPESAGYVRLRSVDPREHPIVQPNYLAEEKDRAVLLAAMKLGRRLFRTPQLAPYFDQELLPGPGVNSDDELLGFARSRGTTAYHLVGTCRMGPATDATAVVDDKLRVHGVEGLRVADASIMPGVPSANTNAATIMIAEKASDMIRGRPPLAPAVIADEG